MIQSEYDPSSQNKLNIQQRQLIDRMVNEAVKSGQMYSNNQRSLGFQRVRGGRKPIKQNHEKVDYFDDDEPYGGCSNCKKGMIKYKGGSIFSELGENLGKVANYFGGEKEHDKEFAAKGDGKKKTKTSKGEGIFQDVGDQLDSWLGSSKKQPKKKGKGVFGDIGKLYDSGVDTLGKIGVFGGKKRSNPYINFLSKHREEIKRKYPNAKPTDIAKHAGALWRNLSEKEKDKYK